jgi:hypothetical protein
MRRCGIHLLAILLLLPAALPGLHCCPKADQHACCRSHQLAATPCCTADQAPDNILPQRVVGRVQAYTGGYGHRIARWSAATADLGAQLTGYHAPLTLAHLYGRDPWGVAVLLKFQLGKGDR